MAEFWDLYDEERNPLQRTGERGKVDSSKGELHVVVMIVTMNSHGQILCTLRSPEKTSYPSAWEITAGAVLAGEDSISGALRELREETGIIASPAELRPIMTVKETSAFIDCFFLRKDIPIQDVVLQEGETSAAKWVGKQEFENMIAQKKVAFPVARRYIELYPFLMQEGFI